MGRDSNGVYQPPYSLHVQEMRVCGQLSDYYLFPKVKKELGSRHFATDDDITNAVDHFLRYQNGAFYTEGIRLLHDRWAKCVNLGGDYVEKLLHLILYN